MALLTPTAPAACANCTCMRQPMWLPAPTAAACRLDGAEVRAEGPYSGPARPGSDHRGAEPEYKGKPDKVRPRVWRGGVGGSFSGVTHMTESIALHEPVYKGKPDKVNPRVWGV